MAITIKRRVSVRKPEPISEKVKTTKHKTLGAKRMSTKEAPQKSRISLWDVESDNERAPIARGTIQLTAEVVEELYELVQDGEEYVELGVSLWTSDSENAKAPSFTGLIKSPSERAAEIEAAKAKDSGGKKGKATRRSSK